MGKNMCEEVEFEPTTLYVTKAPSIHLIYGVARGRGIIDNVIVLSLLELTISV